jgi:SNF2 family DNA or RNA helicase
MAWAAIDPNNGRPMLAIGAAKAEHHLCQAIPGCNYSKDDQIWRLPLSWPGYVCFRTAWAQMPVHIYPSLLAYGEQAWAATQGRFADRVRIDATTEYGAMIRDAEADNAMELRPDQRGAVEWLVKYGRAGIEDPTGNGKTPIVIRALQVQQQVTGTALPALYIANGSALYGIRDKFAAWAPELRVSVVTGTAAARAKALEREADVYIIAWDNLRLHTRLAPYGSERLLKCSKCAGTETKTTPGRCEVHLKELNVSADGSARRWGTVIPDEAHKMRDPTTKQTRAAWWLMWHCEFCWPMTATLVADNVADPWGPMHGIDPRAWPSRSRYIDMFAQKEYAWNRGAEILGFRQDHAYAAHTIIQPYWRRIPREIARPNQPPRGEPEFRYTELSPAHRKVYDQLTREALADLEGASMVTGNDLVKYTRLCQLASSMVEQYDGEDAQGFTVPMYRAVLPCPKADDLIEFLDDVDGQVVVAAISTQLIELAERKLHEKGISYTHIVGGMSAEAQYQANMAFLGGQVRVILISAAGSESIDLQSASIIYFLEPDTSFLAREQKIGRVDRYGQPYAVRQVYALAPGTVDMHRYKLGLEKNERHDSVARDPDLLRWILTGEQVDWSTR